MEAGVFAFIDGMKNKGHSGSHLMSLIETVRFACHPEVRAKKSGI
jgi:hypothetical protein